MEPNASQIAQTLLVIESNLSLDHTDWCIADAHLWPLYRMEIYRLVFAAQAGHVPARPKRALGPVLKRASYNGPASRARVRVWLVSDGISFSQFDGVDFDRFCDPLHRQLERQGVDAVLIDRSSPHPRASRLPMRWWAPWTQRAKVAGMIGSKLRPDRRHDRLILSIQAVAARHRLELPPLDPRRFDAMSRAVLNLSRIVERQMRTEAVCTMLLVSYYDVGGYAYNLAARRCGVVSVDIQHGVTGEYHLGYADWNKEPSCGYGMLPRCFWSWTPADAAVIDRWAQQPTRPARCTVVGGHPFMESWRAQEIPQTPADQARMTALLETAAERPRVLVTLQPGLIGEAALKPLLEVWAKNTDVQWWVRLHPMAFSDRPTIEHLLRRFGVKHWEVDAASSLPLPTLLSHSNAHCTHSSSAVIEAALLEVPSLLWADYGVELFKAQINAGIAIAVTDGITFGLQLTSVCARAATPRRWSGASPIHGALTSILSIRA